MIAPTDSNEFHWPTVSMVSGVRSTVTEQVSLREVLTDIQCGRWRTEIEAVRYTFAAEGKKAADALKTDTLPAFTPSGNFSRRCTEALTAATGVICLDIDSLDAAAVDVRRRVEASPHTLACFASPKGNGLKVLVRVPADPAQHAASWRTAARYFHGALGVDPDPSRKDIAGLCLVSYDPSLYVNETASILAPGGDTDVDTPHCPTDLHQESIAPLRIRALIRNGVPEGAGPHGGRNASSFWIACQLRDEGHGQLEVEKQVLEFAGHCQPPLDPASVRATVASAFKHPPREPAGNPPRHKDLDDDRHPTEPDLAPDTDSAANPRRWWDQELVNHYGQPYFEHTTERGKTVFDGINEVYWAAVHAADHIELLEPAERTFYRYDAKTGLYREVSDDLIKSECAAMLLAAGRKLHPALVEERTDSKLKALVSQLRGLIEHRDAFVKGDRRIVHLANGVLHIDEHGELDLKGFSPEYRSRNQSPIAFQPDARCDRFLNELLLPAVKTDDAVLIQKYAGLCLLGHNLIQRFLILDGEAGRGKTQLALVIQLLVGLTNCTQLRTAHLAERFELYRFLKRTVLVGVDVPADFLNTPGASVIKGLVGGDLFDAEQKGGTGSFQLAGHFNVLITSNARLRVRLEGDVGAWRRRLMIARCDAQPPKKKIPDFGRRLVDEEGSGILNWALVGLRKLLRDVSETGDIRLTPAQSGVVDALLSESDSLRHFLKDSVVRQSGSDLTVNEIIEAYAEYCPAQGWTALPITIVQRQIETLMLELFGTVKVNSISRQDRSQKGFRSVAWKAGSQALSTAVPEQESLL